jgi:hypothetical protein
MTPRQQLLRTPDSNSKAALILHVHGDLTDTDASPNTSNRPLLSPQYLLYAFCPPSCGVSLPTHGTLASHASDPHETMHAHCATDTKARHHTGDSLKFTGCNFADSSHFCQLPLLPSSLMQASCDVLSCPRELSSEGEFADLLFAGERRAHRQRVVSCVRG